MQFGQPHRIEAHALGGIDLLEGLCEGARRTFARRLLKLVEEAKLHGGSLALRNRKGVHVQW